MSEAPMWPKTPREFLVARAQDRSREARVFRAEAKRYRDLADAAEVEAKAMDKSAKEFRAAAAALEVAEEAHP